ncbi:uncharacterized protein K452DRAFT_294938 [Aplosporella prunicola CBS 121167]|uniref:Uncharacterized protein n=1 Tax=Aplosporella prunicola CBS 121167 TaxID=1176127 RepID=A0A6A6BRH9_9PEZI|nr:uncharacterized protein K452DRAFT_294938 [Aplosporella prunicola CBS 121167]KAF2146378.1 hypothetical protein K452DRAFT_294938 [Aplosporella prunicola CBS 121167]
MLAAARHATRTAAGTTGRRSALAGVRQWQQRQQQLQRRGFGVQVARRAPSEEGQGQAQEHGQAQAQEQGQAQQEAPEAEAEAETQAAQEERTRPRTPAELEAAVRAARQAFGDVLPEAHLSGEEYRVYERLYGAPLRVVPMEELVAERVEHEEDGEGESGLAKGEVYSVRDSLFVERKDGTLKAVEYFVGGEAGAVGEGAREVEMEEGEEGEEFVEEVEEGEEGEEMAEAEELGFEAEEGEEEEYEGSGGEKVRAHPLTLAGRWATSPSTIHLPKAAFVEPISNILAAASNKHLSEAAQRVFGGRRLPYSAATPRPAGGELVQKPIPLEPGQTSMAPMESDAYLAAVMPGTYASMVSVLVEVRRRLGGEWLSGLLQKEGGPLILDASSGGAAVVAWREVLRAEWARIQEAGEAAEGAPAPVGKASVVTGADTLRKRAAQFLDNTTFIPRLPETIGPADKVGPKARKVFDVVVAPHFLWGIREEWLRKAALQKLWSLTSPRGGVLVLLEKGLPRGFEVIAGARAQLLDTVIASPGAERTETLLQDSKHKGRWTKKEQAMIVAPCTNHTACPMYQIPGVSRNRKDFCYFKQRYIRPPYLQRLLGARDRNHEDVQFSYLAVQRGVDLRRERRFEQGETAADAAFEGHGFEEVVDVDVEEGVDAEAGVEAETIVAEQEQAQQEPTQEPTTTTEEAAPSTTAEQDAASAKAAVAASAAQTQALTLTLPRLILPPLKRRGHIIMDMCTPAGRLERWTVPRSFGKQAYRDARKARWGDLWALGAATRVPRTVRLGKGGAADAARVHGDAVGFRDLGVAAAKLSKEDKRRLKEKRGKSEKKGRVTRRMDREILLEILSYIPRHPSSQRTLYACCLVNHQWYNAAIARLYEAPHLIGPNFAPFVRTICPSINAHVKRSELAELVRVLDLRHIVHQSSKSVTARLLGRVKGSLEVFMAPQSSFAVNCFAALSKCTKLRTLDLSLTSEAIALASLAHALRPLESLKTLYFPRSSNDSDAFLSAHMRWPPALEALHLSGGIHGRFISGLGDPVSGATHLPPSLAVLSLTHCPRLKEAEVLGLLAHAGPQLRELTVENIRDLGHASLDGVLRACAGEDVQPGAASGGSRARGLAFLRLSLDYITFNAFGREGTGLSSCSLQRLELSSSGDTGPRHEGPDLDLEPLDLVAALDEGFFPELRVVRVAKSAGWHVPPLVEDTAHLSEELKEGRGRGRAREAGVWTIDDE